MTKTSELLVVVVVVVATAAMAMASPSRNKLLLVSFDGFRWNYDQDVVTPHLDQVSVDGVKAKFITPPMLTMTSPSHFTTITGRWVEDHEVVHNMMFDAKTNLKLPHRVTLSKSSWWDNGVLPLWITAQNQGLKTASFYFPGGGANYSGQGVNRAVVEPHVLNDSETKWQENVDKVMSWFSEEDFDLVTLYYGEPDRVGHAKGPGSDDRKRIVEQIDRTIGYMREAMDRHNLADNLNVIITSDHGMTDIKKRPLVDEIVLQKYLNLLQLASFEILDYGGFGILTPRPGKEQQVYDALSRAPNLTVYKKDELPEDFHLKRSKRLPPIVIIADLGFNLNSRFIVYVNKGDHGFHNTEMDMKMIFRAFGPDFKKNFLSEPFDSVHIYALMCELLQIQPAPHNGSLAVTEKMLLRSGGSKVTASVCAALLLLLFTII